MRKMIVPSALLVLLQCLVACGSQGTLVEVSCDDFYEQRHISREVEVPVGDSFTVTLCSNPSTGFQWEEAVISDQSVLEVESHEFVGPESDPPPPPGTPGQDVWVFETLTPGASVITIDYGRPWEGGEKGEWTFVLGVVVN